MVLIACLIAAPALSAPAPIEGVATLREYYFQTTTIEQGLAESAVNAVLQDHAGYIWVGTEGPLQRYDGYGFANYSQVVGEPGGLRSAVDVLAEDAAHRIWVGTADTGLYRLTPGASALEPVKVDATGIRNIYVLLADDRRGMWLGSERGLMLIDADSGALKQGWSLPGAKRPPFIRRLALTADGVLWIGATSGLWRLDSTTAQPRQVDPEHLTSVTALALDAAGRLRIGTPLGLYDLDPQGMAQLRWPEAAPATINAIADDALGRIWASVPGRGIAIIDPDMQHQLWLQPDPLTPGSLPDNNVTTLMSDRSGLMWAGTHDRGLARTPDTGAPLRLLVDHNDRTAAAHINDVHALAGDADGNLWIGDGNGLKRYLPGSGRFEYADDVSIVMRGRAVPSQAIAPVSAIVPAGGRTFWIATRAGVGRFDPGRRVLERLDSGEVDLAATRPYCLDVAADHSLWIGTMRAGLARYQPDSGKWTWYRAAHDQTPGLASDMVLAVHADGAGRVWVATVLGLNLIEPESGRLRVFRHDPGDAHTLSSNTILSLHETADGQLWIGTRGGLNRLDALDAQGARFSRWPQDGEIIRTIYSIQDDGLGRLWLGTNRGIASFNISNSRWRSYSLAQGLQGLKFNAGASTRLRGGELAFGGSDGINLFHPQGIADSRYIAPVVVTRVQLGDEETPVRNSDDAIEMPAGERVVNFQFAALDYSAPERNRFAYQLAGFDERWIEARSRHEATYTNLTPGRYLFNLRGSNSDGFWNPAVTQVELEVIAPWWQSPPAKFGYLVLGAGVLLLAWRTRRARRRTELLHHHDLSEREDRLRLVLWGSGDDFFDWNMASDSIVLTGSRNLFARDHTRSNVKFTRWFRENVHPADLGEAERRLESHIRGQSAACELEYRLRADGAHWVWIQARGKIVERDSNGQPLRMCGTTRDITSERIAEQERRIAHEVFRNMGEAVVVNDLDFRVITVNPAFTRITGWSQAEIEGQSVAVLDCLHHPPEIYLDVRRGLEASGRWHGELWQRRKNGEEFLSWCETQEVRDANGVRTHFVGVISDITERKRVEQELRYLANYDALTGLPNRSLLVERIEQGIVRARNSERCLGVLFLDLDRFKHINDSMGHAAGDSLLRAAGARLRQVVRGNDSVARLGGDEFTVVLEDIAGTADAEAVAAKIIAAFEEPLELDNGQEVVISPSIGISLFPDHAVNANDLLKYADTAMYQAKDQGRRTWMVYVEAMDAAARMRATTIAAMRRSLERAEFRLRYQPKLSLRDGRITGFEALLRWRSAEIGDIAPGVFIPIAEETGMIIEIGNWVIAEACRQLARWRDEGLTGITMSINVSVAQLMHADLISHLRDALATHDLAPSLLELELTESMIMANAERSIAMLRKLKEIGVGLAIDDFGTGYSSLSYLRRLPIDALKIDKEFIDDLTSDPDDEAITSTVIAMAHSLDLNVIAEGVEQEAQVAYLREQDCDEIQGHWLAQPLPPEECVAFVRAHVQGSAARGTTGSAPA